MTTTGASLGDAGVWRLPLATPDDMATYRPPSSFFGYSVTATDEALLQIAEAVAERDEQIALLRREIAQLRGEAASAQGSGAPPSANRWATPGTAPAAGYRAAEDPVWGPPGGYQTGRYPDADDRAGSDPAEGYPGQDYPGQDYPGHDYPGRDDPAEGDAGKEPG